MTPPIASAPFARVTAELADILEFGATPHGRRRVIHILGGRVDGQIAGTILPGGADWQVILPDGTADIHARYTIRTDAGDLVLVDSRGLRHGPPEVMAALARGEAVDPARYFFRTMVRFEAAADGGAAWLNRVMAIASGAREPNAVVLDLWRIT